MDKLDTKLFIKLCVKDIENEVKKGDKIQELENVDKKELEALMKKSMICNPNPFDLVFKLFSYYIVSATLKEKMEKRLDFLEAGGKLEDCEDLF